MVSFISIFAHILFMSMFQMSGSGGQDDPLTLTPTGSRNLTPRPRIITTSNNTSLSPQLLVPCPPSESVGVGTSGWQQRGHLTGTLPSQLLRLPPEWERVPRMKRKTVWSLLQRRGGSLEVQFTMSSMNYKCSTGSKERWSLEKNVSIVTQNSPARTSPILRTISESSIRTNTKESWVRYLTFVDF